MTRPLVCGMATILLWLGLLAPAHAGRPCNEPQALKAETLERSLGLALSTLKTLDASGAAVPGSGTLARFDMPTGPGVRVDTHGAAGATPSPLRDLGRLPAGYAA